MWPNAKDRLFSAVWPILKAAGERKEIPDAVESPGSGHEPTENACGSHSSGRSIEDDRPCGAGMAS